MKKIQHKYFANWEKVVGFFGLGIMTGAAILFGVARVTWHSKFYPGVKVAGIQVGGLTRSDARQRLENATNEYQAQFSFNGSSWVAPKQTVKYELEATLNEAYRYGRRLSLSDYLLLLINKQTNYPLQIATGKTEKMEVLLSEIADSVEITAIDANVVLTGQKVEVINGSDGTVLDMTKLDEGVNSSYAYLSDKPVEIPTTLIKRSLTQAQLESIIERATILKNKGLALKLDDETVKLSGKDLIQMIETDGSQEVMDLPAINEYVLGLKERFDKEPQDAKFEYADGKVSEFAPGRDGVEVDIKQTTTNILTGMQKLLDDQGESKSDAVEIAVTRTPPQVTTDKVNELGIRERIGRGESYYAHSIPNRIFNVALASTRINSALIPPGEEVSFNKMVGEVSSATGYRPAYIISGGRTVLGDGGGLCQVSTTMFRAAMSAGLPILERWGHAYRVSYYELNSKPGVDATVIAPSKDFRFKNDTPGHILIQTINDPKELHLVVEIYGTSDGRVATTTEPKVWGNTPPLPTIYQDDPSLPTGTMKQVDWSAPGAKASFEYKVVRNGEVLQDKTFSTTYRPWASVFLRGTGI